MKFILPLLLSVVALWPRPVTSGEPPVVLVLGDSLSAGYGMRLEDGWVHLLQLRLQDNGYRYRILNSSISGDTTQGGLARLPRLLTLYHPKIVIIELGANDGLRGIDPPLSRRNLAEIIRQSQSSGARVLLAGIRLPPNYGPAYTTQFESMYADLAREHDTLLVPFIMDGVVFDENLLQEDRLHPNEKAQPVLLANVWKVLQGLLSR